MESTNEPRGHPGPRHAGTSFPCRHYAEHRTRHSASTQLVFIMYEEERPDTHHAYIVSVSLPTRPQMQRHLSHRPLARSSLPLGSRARTAASLRLEDRRRVAFSCLKIFTMSV